VSTLLYNLSNTIDNGIDFVDYKRKNIIKINWHVILEVIILIRCNLSILMAERGLNISDVSKDTGISRTTLTSLFHNQSKGIQFDTLETLCNYLQVSISELLTRIYVKIRALYIEEIEEKIYRAPITLSLEDIEIMDDIYIQVFESKIWPETVVKIYATQKIKELFQEKTLFNLEQVFKDSFVWPYSKELRIYNIKTTTVEVYYELPPYIIDIERNNFYKETNELINIIMDELGIENVTDSFRDIVRTMLAKLGKEETEDFLRKVIKNKKNEDKKKGI
jgi:DNA-binding Xre family transcriptional regulator/predicted metallopeptidase